MIVSQKRLDNFVDAMRSVAGNAVKSAKLAESSAKSAHGETAKLKQEIAHLHEQLDAVVKFVDQLSTNGVATKLKALDTEVNKDRKQGKYGLMYRSMLAFTGESDENAFNEVTLKGKVDAIVNYLNLDFVISETKESEVLAKKAKKGKK